MRSLLPLFLILVIAAGPVRAENRTFTLSSDLPYDNGSFLKHLLPRFALKAGIRVTVVSDDTAADARLAVGASGDPAFRDDSAIYNFAVLQASPEVERFRDWLMSDIGQRTVRAYAPDGKQVYFSVDAAVVEEAAPVTGENVMLGEKLALLHCGRCHVVSDRNRFAGIGSTPSFGALRTIPDWDIKFAAFFTLNPHPSFTQVEGITEPFDPQRPPMIAPIELTPDEVEAIAEFAASIPPRDLGAPLQAN